MECPRCRAEAPAESVFCHACGSDLRGGDPRRRSSFAAKPDERVTSLRLVSTIMPRGAGQRTRTYLVALVGAVAVTLLCAAVGALPLALTLAAFAVPVVYVVYLYDVNAWEDEPLPVTLLAFALTFALGLGWTLVWQRLRGPAPTLPGLDALVPSVTLRGLLLGVVLAVVVGEVIRQLGPLVLASRPQFDDLLDGLTFGVVSGVAYSAAETLVTQWPLLELGFGAHTQPLTMIGLVLLHGLVKPLLYGTAVGLACAEFSGLGRGYDGFTPRYWRAALVSVLAIGGYSAAVYLLRRLGNPGLELALALVVGCAVLAGLLLLLRRVLHVGLLEAALASAAGGSRPIASTGELRLCGACEMPTLPGAAFCSACGTALAALPKRRHSVAVPSSAVAAGAASEADAWFDREEGLS